MWAKVRRVLQAVRALSPGPRTATRGLQREPDVGVSHAGVCSNVSRPSDDEHGLGRAVRPAASGLGRVTPYKNDTMHVYPARPRCGQKYVQYYRLYAHYPPAPVLALHVGFKSGMRFSNSVRHLTIGPNTAQYCPFEVRSREVRRGGALEARLRSCGHRGQRDLHFPGVASRFPFGSFGGALGVRTARRCARGTAKIVWAPWAA
jgi:hypothetical protein